ncbi:MULTISPECIES: 1-deoxy-D-xylulose-5-phosphate reductoisomerase [Thalassolituus]|uniref:1-deoxy-D-xylulose-5-phosphate reductoisomerase n=1 Tax=Thalassolituus TaxID=187492 RepID=UPI000C6A5528|nr:MULTISPECIES: 1-deoxy-D-xylulose-5-phosphate reductoisomerase [Thalassolituus]MAX86648.1 1-deoxy-D-xylulose-5-phosphate reductoisomerase [Oceanospirillaceae bacterium]MEE3209759.1 1-deoxy-D-xylulose-5-phosphate reductoisomerase [Pseudomonadota bacterium]TNC89530.1 MAG: 1-deoxy-D-xylulose-5-phosphate reductoisomerase [Thalassolituus sp.]|tara:strand:+ start:10372 stop:11553 length:1182 start_codon:yes stop_codon:yes gene_type:complete
MTQWITVLGSTGSIGCSTLDVVRRHPEKYRVYALTAATRVAEMAGQIAEFSPRYAVMADASAAAQLREQLPEDCVTEVLNGEDALVQVASDERVDQVMAAIVGAAGLLPTLAGANAGKRVLLANKESLVMAGPLFLDAVKKGGAELLPIDSEHNAIFQSMPADYAGRLDASGIRKILLTASGGPFRGRQSSELNDVTPSQAVAHPNWSMGAKISVDSATLMNKGLELIEACFLFNCAADDVEVVVHPESVIHSMVQYCDGSVLAQLGQPDMRTPIAYGMAWPERIEAGVESLNLFDIARLNFEAPDEENFPCLALARIAFAQGGTMPAVLNAANEVAVAAFLREDIRFTTIPALIKKVMDQHSVVSADSLDAVLSADSWARATAESFLQEESL